MVDLNLGGYLAESSAKNKDPKYPLSGPHNVQPPPPPGNSSYLYAGYALRVKSFEAQKSAGIIAVTVSFPPRNNVSTDEVTLNMACVRIAEASKSGDQGNGANQKNGASDVSASKFGLMMVLSVGSALSMW